MNLLYFFMLIVLIVFVHELGHFTFAKLFNVKVLKFAIGFGPTIVSTRRGETEYALCWFPLGGFVKMLGENPLDEIKPEEVGRAFHFKPLWQRFIIVFAGPAFNLIFPLFIYLAFFSMQRTLPPPIVGKVFHGQPAAEAGLLPADKIVAIDGEDIRSWEELQEQISAHPNRSLRFTIERSGKKFERYVTPQQQIVRNRLDIVERVGRIGVSPRFDVAQIGISNEQSPAARGGLKTGDLITSVNGVAIERYSELDAVLRKNRGESLRISFLRPLGEITRFADLRLLSPMLVTVDPEPVMADGRTTYSTGIYSAEFFVDSVEGKSPAERMGMKRGDRVTNFDGQPLFHWETILIALDSSPDTAHSLTWIPFGGEPLTGTFKLDRTTFRDEYKQEQSRYVFGIQNRLIWRMADPVPIDGRLAYTVTSAIRKTGEVVGVMMVAFVQLFKGAIPRDTIGGPVMLYYTAGVAAEKGWDHFLWIMALISINLGLINLFPIPILDGGHILFFTLEAIKRRPVSLRVRELASIVGLMFLVSLMIFAFKNDIVRYWFN